MVIYFEMASYYSQYLGEKQLSLNLPQDEATLEQVIEAFLGSNPNYKEIFKQHFYKDDKIFALFVCCGKILKPESILKDGDQIKVVSPISGG
jgi:molybdopterin converting factor small subunit